MSPTDSEPMSGDDLAREIANIATKQVYYSDPYITNDGVLCIKNRSKFTHTTSPRSIRFKIRTVLFFASLSGCFIHLIVEYFIQQ